MLTKPKEWEALPDEEKPDAVDRNKSHWHGLHEGNSLRGTVCVRAVWDGALYERGCFLGLELLIIVKCEIWTAHGATCCRQHPRAILPARLRTRQLDLRAGAFHYCSACHRGNQDKTLRCSEKSHLGEDHPEGLMHPLAKNQRMKVTETVGNSLTRKEPHRTQNNVTSDLVMTDTDELAAGLEGSACPGTSQHGPILLALGEKGWFWLIYL